jgi:hypothetical protein
MVRLIKRNSAFLFLLIGVVSGCNGGSSAMPGTIAPTVSTEGVAHQTDSGSSHELVYVSNQAANSITAYSTSASGNARPVLTIAGSRTQLDRPVGLTFDPVGNLYVVNHGANQSRITIYSPNASGNAAPSGTIEGSKTHLRAQNAPLDYPTGAIAIDSVRGHLFVGRVSNEQTPFSKNVLVFSLSARGNVAPISSFGDSNNAASTTIYGTQPATALAFGDQGMGPTIIVGTAEEACCWNQDNFTYYSASNYKVGGKFTYALNGNMSGLAIMPKSGDLVASQQAGIDVWKPGVTGNAAFRTTPATAVPLRSYGGSSTGYGALAVDSRQTIWAVVKGSTSATLPQTTGANAIQAFSTNSSNPLTISGPATGLAGVSGIAVLN